MKAIDNPISEKNGANLRDMDGESGMMVVEAVISFTAFIMVCLVITFLINIFMLHNKVLVSYTHLHRA